MIKAIFKVIKQVETDFKSKNEKLNSYLELGTSYFLGNEYSKTLNIFEKAIELEPKNSGGWIGKAITHLAMTEVSEINSVNISDYIEKAIKNSESSKIEKYIQAITLHYGYQYSAAIKLYILQTNQAIAEKQKAQVAAVIGLATAVAGGVIANKSKSFTGTFVGFSMLAGGAGATIKSSFDSFSLDKLSKSLYGNALAQTIISVPTIQICNKIYEHSRGDLKHNVGIILESWKESVINLFINEKSNFCNLLNELKDTDKLLEVSKRQEVTNKIDEILYFMNMIGLDESEDFKKVIDIKKVINSFSLDFDDKKLEEISNERSKAKNGCAFVGAIIVTGLGIMDKQFNIFSEESGISGMVFIGLIIATIVVFWYFYKKRTKIEKKSGIQEIHNKINSVISAFSKVKIETNEINLKLLGQ